MNSNTPIPDKRSYQGAVHQTSSDSGTSCRYRLPSPSLLVPTLEIVLALLDLCLAVAAFMSSAVGIASSI